MTEATDEHLVGVISDTHGLLRLEALDTLAGVELIIHAGDIGKPEILEGLKQIAPVFAVRGNIDLSRWGRKLPTTQIVEAGQVLLYVLHDVAELDLDPAAAGFNAVISGHSHQPSAVERGGVLYLNPGSAGPKRFNSPVSLARLDVQGTRMRAEIIELTH